MPYIKGRLGAGKYEGKTVYVFPWSAHPKQVPKVPKPIKKK